PSFSAVSHQSHLNGLSPPYSTVDETGPTTEGPPSYEEALLSPKPSSGAIQSYEDSIRPAYTYESSPPGGTRVVRSLVAEAESFGSNWSRITAGANSCRPRAQSQVRNRPHSEEANLSKLKKKKREQQQHHRSS